MVISLVGCEKESIQETIQVGEKDIPFVENEEHSDNTIKNISIEDFKKKSFYKYLEVPENINLNSSSGCNTTVYQVVGPVHYLSDFNRDVVIDKIRDASVNSNIVHLGETGNVYAVGVVTMEANEDGSYYENLVVNETSRGTASFIIRYGILDNQIKSIRAILPPDLSLEYSGYTNCGSTVNWIVPCNCTDGNGQPLNHTSPCHCDEVGGTNAKTYTYTTPPCPPEGVDWCFGGIITSQGGQGSNSSNQQPTINCIEGGDNNNYPGGAVGLPPCIPQTPAFDPTDLQLPGQSLITMLNLDPNSEEANWVNNIQNLEKILKIIDFLDQHTENGVTNPEAEAFAEEVIEAYANGTLISDFPFIKYPPGSNYSNQYPKLTEYLKNQLPTIKDNPTIVNAIKNYTSLTEEEIEEDLKWGEGPTINVVQLEDPNICATCSPTTYGMYDTNDPNNLYIDIDLVNDLENSLPGTELADAFSFLVGVTILHEYVHFGDNDGQDYPGEEGELFEIDAYGQTVWKSNALLILKSNN